MIANARKRLDDISASPVLNAPFPLSHLTTRERLGMNNDCRLSCAVIRNRDTTHFRYVPDASMSRLSVPCNLARMFAYQSFAVALLRRTIYIPLLPPRLVG